MRAEFLSPGNILQIHSMNKAQLTWKHMVAQLDRELDWLAETLAEQLKRTAETGRLSGPITDLPIPPLSEVETPYNEFVRSYDLGPGERLLVMLTLAPYLRPTLLQLLATRHPDGKVRPELGAFSSHSFPGFLPTVNTALFLLGGNSLEDRIVWMHFIQREFVLVKQGWIRLETLQRHEPETGALMKPGREMMRWITEGQLGTPDFGADFPAEQITTAREWEELVLSPGTEAQVNELLDWVKYEKVVMDELGLRNKVAPGFRALFYGPPGTGKTFTTSLLGKVTGRPVFRIDLSQVVSKYIGETEKNLRSVFDQAEQRDWILFFDEADALFGKRTSVSDAKDRYANQEVSYLLQRIELHDGLVVLATNHRDNLDKAFTRRFQLVVQFPMPNPSERLRLWQNALPPEVELAEDVYLPELADRYELSGGSIMNVIRYCVLQAARRDSKVVLATDCMEGVRREYRKVGRIIK